MPVLRHARHGRALSCNMCEERCPATRSVPRELLRGDVERHPDRAYTLCAGCYKFTRRCSMIDKNQPHRKCLKQGKRIPACMAKWRALQRHLPAGIVVRLLSQAPRATGAGVAVAPPPSMGAHACASSREAGRPLQAQPASGAASGSAGGSHTAAPTSGVAAWSEVLQLGSDAGAFGAGATEGDSGAGGTGDAGAGAGAGAGHGACADNGCGWPEEQHPVMDWGFTGADDTLHPDMGRLELEVLQCFDFVDSNPRAGATPSICDAFDRQYHTFGVRVESPGVASWQQAIEQGAGVPALLA